MREQAILAAETADAILFFVDSMQGLLPEDREVADFLRKCEKPILLAVNKVDHVDYESGNMSFMSLVLANLTQYQACRAWEPGIYLTL